MTKMLKTIGFAVGFIILIAIISTVILVMFVNPNKFKPLIIAEVSKKTGRELVIDGDLSWTFFPSIGVKVGHATLSNPDDFKQKTFVEIDEAVIGVKLLPLISAKVESTGIALHGLKLTLIKTAEGAVNWQFLSTQEATITQINRRNKGLPKSFMVAHAATVDSLSGDSHANFTLDIPKVEISDAQVTWIDEKAHQTATISHLDLQANQISFSHAFPLKTTFQFSATNPVIAGELSLEGKINLDLSKEQYTVNEVKISIDVVQDNQKIAAELHGNFMADMTKETAELNDLVATVANLTLKGHAAMSHLTAAPRAQGHLESSPFNLKTFLQKIGKDTPTLTIANPVRADFDFTADTSKTASAIQALTVQGKVKIDELQAAKIKARDLTIQTKLKNGVLEFTPVTASLYQGSLTGNAKIILTSATPQISADVKLTDVQAEPLLEDLETQGSKIKVKGAGNIDLQITTSGMTADSVTKNLNGNSRFSFKNGQLSGINIGKMIDTAYAVIKRQSMPTDPDGFTNFGDLTGTLQIHNGVMTNNDLVMSSPRFDVKGQGTIDLVNQQIHYALQTTAKNVGQNRNDKDALNLYNYAIPMTVTGSLSNPAIRLDVGAITAEVAKQQVKKVQTEVQDKIKDQIKEKVAGQAGELLQGLLGH